MTRAHLHAFVTAWATVCAIGVAAFAGYEGISDNHRAVDSNRDAVLHRLEAITAGACYRLNYRGWQDDLTRFADYKRDVQGSHHAVHAMHNVYRVAVANDFFVPLTDCKMALSHPETYKQPTAIPFTQLSTAELDKTLLHPPQPPAFSVKGYR